MALDEVLDLAKAFRRVQQDKNDDTWPDIVGYRDYSRSLAENLQNLRARLARPNSYVTNLPLGIDLPKRGFTLRPGLVPLIDDRLVYQAVADYLTPHFAAEPCVYSNRLTNDPASSRMFVPGVELWLEFQASIERLCLEYPYVVETDLTAYFEHINHDLLLHRLDDLFQDRIDRTSLREIKQLLQRLWRGWNTSNHRFGIPQVNNASSFFANLYLDELDKWMLRQNYVYLRYVDDIRIFTFDEPNARRALSNLIPKLREMGLYVGSAKTAIKPTRPLVEELVEGRRRMDEIETELAFRTPQHLETAAAMIETFFHDIVDDPAQFNDRHFRYCVNRFKRLRVNNLGMNSHNRVAEESLRRLISMPYSSDIFVDYLSLFPDDEMVQRMVVEFLESPYNIYPWQEMLLLELLIRSSILPIHSNRIMTIARAIARDSHKHPACRAKAIVLWGKNGDYADRREIRAMYFEEAREDIRRAIVFAIQEMQPGERNSFFDNVSVQSNSIRQTAQYVLSLQRPLYHHYNPPAGFDIIQEYEADIPPIGWRRR
jgi:hypothetical protein